MTDTPEPLTPAQKRAADRDARVAAKLRENLRRRKQAARKQKSSDAASEQP